jgi:DNA polymerase-3 subunit delta'
MNTDSIDATDVASASWLQESFEQLKQAFDQWKIAHGILMAAPKASGKRALAKAFTQSVLCETSASGSLNKACGLCKSCQLVAAQTHPDLTNVDCLVDAKGKQKQSIGIDQIRQLNAKLVETAQLGKWRLAVIFSVEKMTRGAFNALLKTLEEPGRDTLLILLADNIYQVPATIRSRCQVISLKLSQDKLVPWLITQTNCDNNTAVEALNYCSFAPYEALNFINQNRLAFFNGLRNDLDTLLATRITPQEFVAKYADDESVLWRYIADYFQRVQLQLLSGTNSQYQSLNPRSPSELYQQLIEMNRGQSAGSNLQARLQLEGILSQWFEIGRKIVHYSSS